MTLPLSQQESTKAWELWQALHEYADILWQRYEQPFMDFIFEEQQRDSIPQSDSPEDLDEEDIPF